MMGEMLQRVRIFHGEVFVDEKLSERRGKIVAERCCSAREFHNRFFQWVEECLVKRIRPWSRMDRDGFPS
jgi:hypothetical protein